MESCLNGTHTTSFYIYLTLFVLLDCCRIDVFNTSDYMHTEYYTFNFYSYGENRRSFLKKNIYLR